MRSGLMTSCAALAMVVATARPARAADPTTGDCLAATEAALKSGNDHKLRAERSQLLVCGAASCPSDIRKDCAQRIDALNAQIPTIIFQAKDGAGKDIMAVKVTMDGEALAERLEGTSLSIDPGNHTFVFETPGQPTVTEQLVITEGEKDRRERIVFGAASPAGGVPGTPAPTPGALPTTPELGASSSSSGLGTQKILALVAGGVGVVGLGIGTAFGVMAMSQKSDAQSACPGSQCATQDGLNKWNNAGSTGNVSTIGFVIGGVGIAGAAVLWFTAPSSGGSSTQVGFGPGVLRVKGTF